MPHTGESAARGVQGQGACRQVQGFRARVPAAGFRAAAVGPGLLLDAAPHLPPCFCVASNPAPPCRVAGSESTRTSAAILHILRCTPLHIHPLPHSSNPSDAGRAPRRACSWGGALAPSGAPVLRTCRAQPYPPACPAPLREWGGFWAVRMDEGAAGERGRLAGVIWRLSARLKSVTW